MSAWPPAGRSVAADTFAGSSAMATALLSMAVSEHVQACLQLEQQALTLAHVASCMVEALRSGSKILFCGNGGSAADAQHLTAELVGRFRQPRRGLAALALTTDSSVLTSIANDFGYREVFRRQVEALGAPGDLLVGLSTSGESENVCAAVSEARRRGLYTVALVGGTGGRLAELADSVLCVASASTARVQEAHLLCGHVLCELVECAMIEAESATSPTEATRIGDEQPHLFFHRVDFDPPSGPGHAAAEGATPSPGPATPVVWH